MMVDAAGFPVGDPSPVHLVRDVHGGAFVDAAAARVVVGGGLVPGPELQRCRRFLRVPEPQHVEHFRGAEFVGEEPERTARGDRPELLRVADQPQHRAAFGGQCAEPVQVPGAGLAGFVDEQHVPGPERGRVQQAVLVSGQQQVDRLRGGADLLAEFDRRVGARREADDLPAGGLARPGRAGPSRRISRPRRHRHRPRVGCRTRRNAAPGRLARSVNPVSSSAGTAAL